MRAPSDTHGRSTRRFKAMAAEVRSWRQPCCYCGQPIAYDVHHNLPRAFTVAHWLPVKTHPHLAEVWSNIRGAAHRACNSSAGTSNEPPGLGLTSDL